MHHQTSSGATIFRTQTSKTFLKKACTAKHANTTPRGNRSEAKASLSVSESNTGKEGTQGCSIQTGQAAQGVGQPLPVNFELIT